jgi:glycosyltransferase involved in cell wall biosynthesis
MRIAYDYQIFGWQPYGGISRYFYELAKEISRTAGQEVTIVSPVYVNQYLADKPDSLEVRGVRVRPLPRGGRIYRIVNGILARPILSRLAPAIVHETYYSRHRTSQRGPATVLTVYDMVHEKFSRQYARLDPTSAEKAAAVARVDHIVCISKNTQRDLVEILSVPVQKTSVVYLGSSDLLRHLVVPRPSAGRPFLLYVGVRKGYKNFHRLLAAYSRSPLLKRDFDLVCFGGEALGVEERSRARELGVPAGNLRHASGGDDRLAQLYASATALVYPSVYEGFGIPPLEAMSVGCPVICSNSSSLPEVVGDAAELFDPLDEDQMRSAIERVVTSEGLRRDLVERGRRRCALFSWKRCAEETLAVYRKLRPEQG